MERTSPSETAAAARNNDYLVVEANLGGCNGGRVSTGRESDREMRSGG